MSPWLLGDALVARLEEILWGPQIAGVLADQSATVVHVDWRGTEALTLAHRDGSGKVADQFLVPLGRAAARGPDDDPGRSLSTATRPCSAWRQRLPRSACRTPSVRTSRSERRASTPPPPNPGRLTARTCLAIRCGYCSQPTLGPALSMSRLAVANWTFAYRVYRANPCCVTPDIEVKKPATQSCVGVPSSVQAAV